VRDDFDSFELKLVKLERIGFKHWQENPCGLGCGHPFLPKIRLSIVNATEPSQRRRIGENSGNA
jgi:hypothetical protein